MTGPVCTAPVLIDEHMLHGSASVLVIFTFWL